jgi:hypothetical protein
VERALQGVRELAGRLHVISLSNYLVHMLERSERINDQLILALKYLGIASGEMGDGPLPAMST